MYHYKEIAKFSHVIFSLFFVTGLYSQEKINVDSLQYVLKYTTRDTTRIEIYRALSNSFFFEDILTSEAFLDTAYQIANENNLDKIKPRIIFELGNVYTQKGQYQLALSCFLTFLQAQEQNKDRNGVAIAYAAIGNVYNIQQNLDDALLYYQKSLDNYNDLSNHWDLNNYNRILNNIANIHKDKNDNLKALETYRISYGSSLRSKDLSNLGNVCNNMGDLFMQMNSYDSALHYLEEGLRVRTAVNDFSGIIKSKKNIASYYIQRSEYDKAISLLKEIEPLAEKTGEIVVIIDINDLLSLAYQRVANYDLALRYYKFATVAKDSLFNVNMTRALAKQEMKFEFDKREGEIKYKQHKKELSLFVTIGILAFVLIIIALLFFLGRSRVKRIELEQKNLLYEKQSLEQEVELRNKELATNVMYLVKKNEFLNDITKKMVLLKEKFPPDNRALLQGVIFDIQRSIDTEVWQEFEVRFQNVHVEFYKHLSEKFPDLSPNEIKLCAFLRLNMTTKEIASLLHKNEKSIAVARARLRRKLNLTNTETDLINFLSSL